MTDTAVAAPPDAAGKFEKWSGFYIQLRDKKKEIEERHEKELETINKTMEQLTSLMMDTLEKIGAQNIKTSHGTVYVSARYSASLADPQAFMSYVIANQKFELLDRKANATACRDFTEANGATPPGVSLTAIRTLGVRRASK